jgi:hydroxyacyl-ACP dehydratase HTD2-like protein with hotdog domain
MDVEEMRRRFVGQVFDTDEFEVREKDVLAFARACGETDPRFTDPTHPDFQAPPTYTARFTGRRAMPEGFPAEDLRRAFDAGKCVTAHAPVRVGRRLAGDSRIADVYVKTGRTGSMVFIVHRMEFRDDAGQPVSTVDWRLVRREAP